MDKTTGYGTPRRNTSLGTEEGTFSFKTNGQLDNAGKAKLNEFLGNMPPAAKLRAEKIADDGYRLYWSTNKDWGIKEFISHGTIDARRVMASEALSALVHKLPLNLKEGIPCGIELRQQYVDTLLRPSLTQKEQATVSEKQAKTDHSPLKNEGKTPPHNLPAGSTTSSVHQPPTNPSWKTPQAKALYPAEPNAAIPTAKLQFQPQPPVSGAQPSKTDPQDSKISIPEPASTQITALTPANPEASTQVSGAKLEAPPLQKPVSMTAPASSKGNSEVVHDAVTDILGELQKEPLPTRLLIISDCWTRGGTPAHVAHFADMVDKKREGLIKSMGPDAGRAFTTELRERIGNTLPPELAIQYPVGEDSLKDLETQEFEDLRSSMQQWAVTQSKSLNSAAATPHAPKEAAVNKAADPSDASTYANLTDEQAADKAYKETIRIVSGTMNSASDIRMFLAFLSDEQRSNKIPDALRTAEDALRNRPVAKKLLQEHLNSYLIDLEDKKQKLAHETSKGNPEQGKTSAAAKSDPTEEKGIYAKLSDEAAADKAYGETIRIISETTNGSADIPKFLGFLSGKLRSNSIPEPLLIAEEALRNRPEAKRLLEERLNSHLIGHS